MKSASALVLVSGGPDSAVLLADCLARYRRVVPLFVGSGLRWERAELYWLRRFVRRLKRRRLGGRLKTLRVLYSGAEGLLPASHWAARGRVPSWRASWGSVYLPGRNLLLLSHAAAFAAVEGFREIVLGTLSTNPFPDSRPRFLKAFERAAGLALGRGLVVRTPYAGLSKEEVLRRGRGLPLELTFSCLHPSPHGKGARGGGPIHCGLCAKCFERRRAFRRAGLADLARYAARPSGMLRARR